MTCSSETPEFCNCGGLQCKQGERCCYCPPMVRRRGTPVLLVDRTSSASFNILTKLTLLPMLRRPNVYFYRDRDGCEIDLLFLQDGPLYPVEFKRGASPKKAWVSAFKALARFPEKRGPGAVISLAMVEVPLSADDRAVSVAW